MENNSNNQSGRAKRTMSKTQIMVESALLIALGCILAQIKIYRMPMGGSVTLLSMLPFIMISFRHGTKWGIISSIANVILQIVLGGLYMPAAGTVIALLGSVFFDYILSYMVLGFAYTFSLPFRRNKAFSVAMGTLIVCFLRFLASFISGFLIWGSLTDGVLSAVVYSLGYNASYMIPETVLTVIGVYAFAKKAPQLFQ